MPSLAKFQDLLTRELKVLHHGGMLQRGALPKLARAAVTPALKSSFRDLTEQTRRQLVRLEKALGQFKLSPRGKSSPAIKDLILECHEVAAGPGSRAVKDAALIVIAQKIGHHGISGYGSARTLAQILGHDAIGALLQQSLEEAVAADRRLTDIAIELYTGPDTAELDEPFIAGFRFNT